MIKKMLKHIICLMVVFAFGAVVGGVFDCSESKALNPYLPLWEHIPDGEPYVFEDPDEPGKYRLYVYGSHDTHKNKYCGDNFVVWSAPVEDLTDWECHGVVYTHNGHTLFAPDITEVVKPDGSKEYYLYPNDQSYDGTAAKSDSPEGPFEVYATNSVLGFDPAVFVDDDGRVYGYWGFQSSSMAELDPNTMCTIKSGCRELKEADTGIDGSNGGKFRFFEASSMRKITDNGFTKYVFVYSRMSQNGEFGMGATNATLAYAYSDTPLGPWTYGGTIVDARAREKDENGNNIATQPAGNTHGSLVEVNGEWFIFYHRCINNDQYSRQGTAERVEVSINDNGEVIIPEAELTSEGLEVNGLDPYKNYSAGITCYMTGGPYIKATYDENYDGAPVCNNKNNAKVGFKYFNFNKEYWQDTEFELDYMAKGNDGVIKLMLDSPWESKGGVQIGEIQVKSSDSKNEITTAHIEIPELDDVSGKHALYFVFSANHGNEIADLYDFRFELTGINPATPTPVPTEVPTQAPAPSATTAPTVSDDAEAKVGAVYTNAGCAYKVISKDADGNGTVAFAGAASKNIKKVVIPKKVTILGKTYKVTAIEKKAFAGCKKLKNITVKSKTIKKVGKACFKGIHKKAVIKVPKARLKAYKKLFKGKGQKKTVVIK